MELFTMFSMEHSLVSGTAMAENYHMPLVILSVLMAILSSFTAFGIAERAFTAPTKKLKRVWSMFGAFSMGLGIWSMHFLGILALTIDVPISYDIQINLISIIPAVAACSVVLWMMTQTDYSHYRLITAGILLGSGIGIMHYTGMAAMKMNAVMVHNSSGVYFAILMAVIMATLALSIQANVGKHGAYQFLNKKKAFSALVMGGAMSSMHYIAMLSVDFLPKESSVISPGISSIILTIMICIAMLIILLFAVLIPHLLRYRQIVDNLIQLNAREQDNIKRIEKHSALLAQSEKNARLSEQQVQNVLEGAQLGYWDWNYKTGQHSVNDRWLSMLGLSRSDINNDISDWARLIHPEDKQRMIEIVNAHIQSKTGYVAEFRMKHGDGHWVWIEGSGAVIEYDDISQLPLKLCGTHQDISERKQSEEQIKLISRVFSDSLEGVIITNADGIIVDVNPSFTKITDYTHADAIGQNPRILNSGKQSAQFYQEMWQQINQSGFWQGEIWNRKKGGEIYAVLMSISSLVDDKQNIINYICNFTDITSSKKQQEKIRLMAHYDMLTGLPNRALFVDRFSQAIAHSKRSQKKLAICFVDLDNFKPVNDNYGHDVGDKLLVEVAKRISENIREEDTVSRQGGDEFALLLNDVESFSQCEHTLKRIHHALAEPYIIDKHHHKITATSGITLYPDDDGDIDTLLRHADQAMYRAKLAGKHRYHLFDPKHDQRAIEKHHQLAAIRLALINNEFELYYQPKVNMVSGEVFGAEALIRWIHPERGVIPPLDFLPIIDGTDLEVMIGDWVVSEALCQLEQWNKNDIKLEVSVNISSHHLLSSAFFEQLDAALAKHPSVDPNCLQLEILESSALGDLSAISTIIETCQAALGVNVALDDFGTGYSSLTHLRSLPADTIKIDRSFVRDMLDDPSDEAIINGIIGLAESFNRNVIAEGVESNEHGLMLLVMGCKQVQGYGIAKPMPAQDFPLWLANYIPNQQSLEYGHKHRSDIENKVKLFKLVTQHWKNSFINNIKSSPESVDHWPIINDKQCSCGAWIKRTKQERLFGQENLQRFQQSHESLHAIAQTLYRHYLNGDHNKAREGLISLQDSFEQMNQMLSRLLIDID